MEYGLRALYLDVGIYQAEGVRKLRSTCSAHRIAQSKAPPDTFSAERVTNQACEREPYQVYYEQTGAALVISQYLTWLTTRSFTADPKLVQTISVSFSHTRGT